MDFRGSMRKSELLELIANGENSTVEFKLDDIRPEQLAKEIVALANLNGGHILLGVADDKSIVGIKRENLSEWVTDTVFTRYVHPIILPYYKEIQMDNGKRIAVIRVEQGITKPYVVRANDRETAYIRIGAITRPATREQLLMLGSASGTVHPEIMPVHRTSFKSLDMARLDNYLRDIIKDPDIPKSRNAWITRLKALGFMTDSTTTEPVCTIAGLVLFGIKPRQYLRQAGMRIMFFDAMDMIYQAQMDKILDAPLVGRFKSGKSGKTLIDAGLIEKTLELIEPFITRESNHIDKNFRRPKKWLYPFEAVRELLINALAHRDWTRFVDVEIVGYNDRLEITSPGALPNSMTIEKMLAGQRSARNSILVEVLRDYGYVDARGMGIRTKVVPLIKKSSGYEPKFEATEDYLKTVVRTLSVSENVLENEEMSSKKTNVSENVLEKSLKPQEMSSKKTNVSENVLEKDALESVQGQLVSLLKHNPHMTYEELAQRMGCSTKTVQRHLQQLKIKGLIRRIGGAKGGHWNITIDNR
jgi:ATP-dependent DNA helicase RecG